jgi:hypothetical protein
MPISISGTQITLPDSTILNGAAYANFGTLFDDALQITIASTASDGTTMPIYRTFSTPKNITVTTSSSGGTWTHALTGIYALHMSYRQASGGDIWTQYAVTKDGTNNVVGVTARMGSEDSHTEDFHIIYRVDSTVSNYRIQGWCHATGRTAGVAGTPSGNPGWVGSDTSITNGGSWKGRTVDIWLFRICSL